MCFKIKIIEISDDLKSKSLIIRGFKIKIVPISGWCPSHVGVLGNETVDRQATAAARDASNASNAEVPYSDWYPIIQPILLLLLEHLLLYC